MIVKQRCQANCRCQSIGSHVDGRNRCADTEHAASKRDATTVTWPPFVSKGREPMFASDRELISEVKTARYLLHAAAANPGSQQLKKKMTFRGATRRHRQT